jgi:ribonuclease Z
MTIPASSANQPASSATSPAQPTGQTPDARSRKETDRTRLQHVVLAGQRLSAVSVGASETCVIASEHRLAFDIGRCPKPAVACSVVAFTHLHIDHVGGLAFHVATRALQKMSPPTYLVPRGTEDAFSALITAFAALDGGSAYPCTVIPFGPGDEFAVKRGWVLKSFPTFHTVPSQGYLLYSERRRLDTELYGSKSGPELAALRRSGVEVSVATRVPELAVTGDTTMRALEECADARAARTLVTEITFLDNSCTVEEARKFGHVHVDEVAEKTELFAQNEAVLFTHFSARYCSETIRKLVAEKLPADLLKKSTLLHGARISVDDECDDQSCTV